MKKESIALRILIVGCLIVLLLIPLFMIQALITERQTNRNVSVKEISKSWAGLQTIAGPILTTITMGEKVNKEGNKVETKKRNFYLPEHLSVEAKVNPEKRYRGIYSAIVYKTNLKIKGSFSNQKIKEIFSDPSFKESYLSLNINDPRGIQQNVIVKWNNLEQTVIPGLKDKNIFINGFHSDVSIDKDQPNDVFEINLTLNGVDEINFVPVGKNTEVKVSSTWNDPSFTGNFLPSQRKIDEKGFTATWNVNHFNRQFPQEWSQSTYDIFKDKFGVKFYIPADEYQQTMRSSKYGLMLIIFTFVSFFLVEVFSGKAIHPIQYLLIGLALIIFYSMLLALSEYILFQYSYLIAGSLVIGLITLYTRSIYKNRYIVLSISSMLILFYGFVYVLLQLQDYSLLLGNIALFLILAAIMFFTRKVNWFDVLNNKSNNI
ncbi:MAG: cell envelope integrity protein CreD [Ignavibacterium sp.]|nr:cell envelope integrity protein CreD [Ignavibacterium sp.]